MKTKFFQNLILEKNIYKKKFKKMAKKVKKIEKYRKSKRSSNKNFKRVKDNLEVLRKITETQS